MYVLVDACEESNTSAELAKICLESYIKRPSVKKQAINMIGNFMNNMAIAKRRPQHWLRQDAVALFTKGRKARWLISGAANAFLFSEGALYKASQDKENARFGDHPIFEAVLEPEITLPAAQNAIFLCTDSFLEQVPVDILEQSLREADNAHIWMQTILEHCESMPEGSALAAMLPQKKRIPLWIVFLLLALLILAVGISLHMHGWI